jgi:hypothetical protein
MWDWWRLDWLNGSDRPFLPAFRKLPWPAGTRADDQSCSAGLGGYRLGRAPAGFPNERTQICQGSSSSTASIPDSHFGSWWLTD